MELLKTSLLACALLALALARPDREDRESHRANKHAAQRRVSDSDETLDDNRPFIERCNWTDKQLNVCQQGLFCLRDDWRCVTNKDCRHKGGWCVPNFTADLIEQIEERRRLRRDSDESEDRE